MVALVSAAELSGGPGPDLWVGMALGQAFQLTKQTGVQTSGVFDFRPHAFIVRRGPGLLPGEFAVAPEPHSFVMSDGRHSDGSEFELERFVGGPSDLMGVHRLTEPIRQAVAEPPAGQH